MNFNLLTVIIRSIGERTEALCKKLILEQGFPQDQIFIINEVPFSKALKVGFEIGVSENRQWTFCVDADVLLRPGSIQKLLNHAKKQPSNVCEIQGYVLDKFFGGARTAGNHLYRTKFLPKIIKMIPPDGKDIRPETYALNAMKRAGYPWHNVQELVGLHDFEQSKEDIFRKCFVQAHKHINHSEMFIPFWRSKSGEDIDYQIALQGFAEGIKYTDEVVIDKEARYAQKPFLNAVACGSKKHLDLTEWNSKRVQLMIQNWVEPIEYWEKYPGGMFAGNGSSIFLRVIAQFRWYRGYCSIFKSTKLVLSWLLIGAAKRLRGRGIFT